MAVFQATTPTEYSMNFYQIDSFICEPAITVDVKFDNCTKYKNISAEHMESAKIRIK